MSATYMMWRPLPPIILKPPITERSVREAIKREMDHIAKQIQP